MSWCQKLDCPGGQSPGLLLTCVVIFLPRAQAWPRHSLMTGGLKRIRGVSLSCPPSTLYLVGVLTLSHLRGQGTHHLEADPGALLSLHAGLPVEAAVSPPPSNKPEPFVGG